MDYWKPTEAASSQVYKDFVDMIRSNKNAQGQSRKLLRGIQEFGPYHYKMPNSEKLGDGLFELRDTVNHYRYYYCETDFCMKTVDGRTKSVLLMLFAGQNKDRQMNHIHVAKRRMHVLCKENVLNSNGNNFCSCDEEQSDGCT